ncbi:MAG: sel1 repeat family protein [Lachnospiraceae bacterium]|nr:sel1 repeat family protein [Lachnospiraceae bacterium]
MLASLLEDLIPGQSREKTTLTLAVSAGVGDLFFTAETSEDAARNGRIEHIREFLTEELGLTGQRAAYIVNAFSYALGFHFVEVDPNETTDYRELAERYEKEGHKEIAALLYGVISDVGNDEARFKSGVALLKSEFAEAREKGFEILKRIDRKDACYLVGVEYIEGKLTERDFQKAGYYLSKAMPYPKALLEMGKLYFYGWGVKPDIHKAIRLFEQYLKKNNWSGSRSQTCEWRTDNVSGQSSQRGISNAQAAPAAVSAQDSWADTAEDITAVLNATPFLIECYYEDILCTKSFRSMEKLTSLADFQGWRMAQRYLLSYYSDAESDHYNEFQAEKYQRKLERNKENPYVRMSRLHGNMGSLMMELKITSALYMYSEGAYMDSAVNLRDHLILGEELNPNGHEDNGALSYLLMGEMFIKSGAVAKNLLRAEIYIRNYLETVSEIKEPKNYTNALIIYSKLLLEHRLGTPKWNSADKCLELAEEISGEPVREELIADLLKMVRYYGNHGESEKAIICLEKAVDFGYRDDYSIIGMVYLNGDDGIEKDEEKGFYWLKKFYDDYMMERLTLEEEVDLGPIEFMLGECYYNGIGVANSREDAIVYYQRAIEHGSASAKEKINFIA